MSEDPLAKLLVSESQSINRQELYDLLLPYVTINKESQSLDFSHLFEKLTNINKVFILLAAIKARYLILGTNEKIAPSEIIKMDVMKEGSVKNTLKKLLDGNEIKSDDGKYYLPNYKIAQMVVNFKNKNNK